MASLDPAPTAHVLEEGRAAEEWRKVCEDYFFHEVRVWCGGVVVQLPCVHCHSGVTWRELGWLWLLVVTSILPRRLCSTFSWLQGAFLGPNDYSALCVAWVSSCRRVVVGGFFLG